VPVAGILALLGAASACGLLRVRGGGARPEGAADWGGGGGGGGSGGNAAASGANPWSRADALTAARPVPVALREPLVAVVGPAD